MSNGISLIKYLFALHITSENMRQQYSAQIRDRCSFIKQVLELTDIQITRKGFNSTTTKYPSVIPFHLKNDTYEQAEGAEQAEVNFILLYIVIQRISSK
ncbi:hypothetical protein H6G27_34885 [Nostoc linckia FACHB-104]|nr:hypothetical protein [Nostoc linckia FACHB-104]